MEYSLDGLVEKIDSKKTKEYFKEVISSYHIGNYRSAVVMLWSVIIFDLFHKLEYLADMENNKKAKEIMAKIIKSHEKDNRSSAWEINLLEKAQKELKIISLAEYENLKYIQQQRHLCAHPILNDNNELNTPNKDTVRALITNALIGLFIKPAYYTKDIFDSILSDLEEHENILINDSKKLDDFLTARYLNRLPDEAKENIFRSLWKITFRLEKEKPEKNRVINNKALRVLAKYLKKDLTRIIEREKAYYSSISSNPFIILCLIAFLFENRQVYKLLNQDVQILVEEEIRNNIDAQLASIFLYDNEQKYFDKLKQWLKDNKDQDVKDISIWSFLVQSNDTDKWEQECYKLMSLYYTLSKDFDRADDRFQEVILPFIKDFKHDALIYLLEGIENNSQVYDRRRAKQDHSKIIDHVKEWNEKVKNNQAIDMTKYKKVTI